MVVPPPVQVAPEQPEQKVTTSSAGTQAGKELLSGEKEKNRPPTTGEYTVEAGDTLESIAGKVYGNRYKWSRLVQANRDQLGQPPYILSLGMHLRVPPLAEEDEPVLNDDGTYTVQSGDSLGSIARKVYGTSRRWEHLYELNRDQLPTPGALQVGLKLRISDGNENSPGPGSPEMEQR